MQPSIENPPAVPATREHRPARNQVELRAAKPSVRVPRSLPLRPEEYLEIVAKGRRR